MIAGDRLFALLALHAAVTCYMVGVIWFVELVHYPLFDAVGTAGFAHYARAHARRTTWVVAGPMLVELLTAVGVVVWLGGPLAWTGLALVGLVWLSTVRWQVPAHGRLAGGFDAVAHRRLVRTNWVRTLAWSLRGFVAVALLVGPR